MSERFTAGDATFTATALSKDILEGIEGAVKCGYEDGIPSTSVCSNIRRVYKRVGEGTCFLAAQTILALNLHHTNWKFRFSQKHILG